MSQSTEFAMLDWSSVIPVVTPFVWHYVHSVKEESAVTGNSNMNEKNQVSFWPISVNSLHYTLKHKETFFLEREE